MRRLRLGHGCLPYHPWRPDCTWKIRDYRPSLYLSEGEQQTALRLKDHYGPYILVEPTPLDRKNDNRRWPTPQWQTLVNILVHEQDLQVLQLDRPGANVLSGIPAIQHRNFREACAIVQQATLCVLPSGGLAIGAGTVGAPSVVLWGGCDPCETFGFPEHINVVDPDPRTPCGGFVKPCPHCAQAWARLTPDAVVEVVARALDAAPAAVH